MSKHQLGRRFVGRRSLLGNPSPPLPLSCALDGVLLLQGPAWHFEPFWVSRTCCWSGCLPNATPKSSCVPPSRGTGRSGGSARLVGAGRKAGSSQHPLLRLCPDARAPHCPLGSIPQYQTVLPSPAPSPDTGTAARGLRFPRLQTPPGGNRPRQYYKEKWSKG